MKGSQNFPGQDKGDEAGLERERMLDIVGRSDFPKLACIQKASLALAAWEHRKRKHPSEEIYKVIHTLCKHFPDVGQKIVRKTPELASSKLNSKRPNHILSFISVLQSVDTP